MPIDYVAIGEKVISEITLEITVNEIHQRINNVYYDVCSAHIRSANQALDAINRSSSPLNELVAALNHIRTSCNLLELLMQQKQKIAFIIEVNRLSKTEMDSVRYKLSLLYSAQAILHCLTTNNDGETIRQLLTIAKDYYKNHILFQANKRNEEGYDVSNGIEIVNDPGEWSCSHQETYSHYEYSPQEKKEYIQSELKKVDAFEHETLKIINRIGI